MRITAEEDYARNARIYKGVRNINDNARLGASITVTRELLEDMPGNQLERYVRTRLTKLLDEKEAELIYDWEVERCRREKRYRRASKRNTSS